MVIYICTESDLTNDNIKKYMCGYCHGSGQEEGAQNEYGHRPSVDCPHCDGMGWFKDIPPNCRNCEYFQTTGVDVKGQDGWCDEPTLVNGEGERVSLKVRNADNNNNDACPMVLRDRAEETQKACKEFYDKLE